MAQRESAEMTREIRRPGSRERVTINLGGKSRTKQSFKDEADVNAIVRKFQRTGVFTHTSGAVPRYADVSNATDLLGSFEAVQRARDEFGELPASVRVAAGNNPVTLLAMMDDEAGRAVLDEAGLFERPDEPVVVPEVVAEAVAPAGEAPVAPVTETG